MLRPYVSRGVQERVRARAKYRCEYCLIPRDYSTDPFCVEHIWPVVKGGSSSDSNLAFSCTGCNSFKGALTHGFDEETKSEAPLYDPRTDAWNEHFRWSESSLEIEARTATGRVTINCLKLNRKPVQNIRGLLKGIGVHPRPDG